MFLKKRIWQALKNNWQVFNNIGACAVFGLFSIWEVNFAEHLQERYASTPLDWYVRFLVFHIGDLNNSYGMAACFGTLLDIFLNLKRRTKITLAAATTTIIFIYIERQDPWDIPAAIIGVLFYAAFVLPEASTSIKFQKHTKSR